MKRKAVILALVFSFIFCFFAVTAFAEDSGNVLPFAENEEIMPVNPELEYGEEDLEEFYEELFGESAGVMLAAVISMMISMLLFVPALVVMIIFLVLNGKTKRKVKDYERMFGGAPYAPAGVISNQYGAPAGPYQYQPQVNSVNTTYSPLGTAPGAVNMNDTENEQGGQM